ncbi:MAG: peptidylprolyl isomerase [Gaiellaceae bacterium MAG52_C11]|nr:peptidylprolyl isomerase [Candidatus Gaiellasilicea maunaloa]
MKITRLLLLPVLVLALVVGCGGDEDVPKDAVAVVDGQKVARSEYQAILDQAKKSYKVQKRDFPAAGSQEFQTLKNQVVQFLVQRVEFEQQAEELEIEVTEKQVDARLAQIKKQYFAGDPKRYEKQLRDQGLTEKQIRGDIRSQIISEGIFKKVTADVKVTDQAIKTYYEKNQAQYSQPESREVRHILVKTRAQADDVYDQLQNGSDFSDLAKKVSLDTGSKANGGKLTISKGQTVAPFDQTAFLLENERISRPIKTEFGFHIIQPLKTAKAAKVTPLADVKQSIRQQLQQTRKNEKMTKWIDDLKKEYEDQVSYAIGFTPPPAGTTGATTDAEE